MIVREIVCKSGLGPCGFPGGGFSINPYVGCQNGCKYCYARFIKRFTNHAEPRGEFVDVRTNIVEIVKKQIKNKKYFNQQIFIGTVTDPYQDIENNFNLTRDILQVLKYYPCHISILTKSKNLLKDIDIIKQLPKKDVNITINSLDEQWISLTEPHASSIKDRLNMAHQLSNQGIDVNIMIGPFWPVFTDIEKIFFECSKIGIKHIFSESFNIYGGNFVGVENVLLKHYPQINDSIKNILLNKKNFDDFYQEQKSKIQTASKKYGIGTSIFFGKGHAGKFEK